VQVGWSLAVDELEDSNHRPGRYRIESNQYLWELRKHLLVVGTLIVKVAGR
jgi:hypothetical protein